MKFGFLGCGPIATFHADTVLAFGGSIAAACARPNSSRLKTFAEKFQPAHVCEGLESFLPVAAQMDALVVSTSWNATQEVLGLLLPLEKPLLVEKPVALTAKKIEEWKQRYPQATQKVAVGYNRRFYDFIPKIKEKLLTSSLRSVDILLPESASTLAEKYGDAILDHLLIYMSSHWIDLVTSITGPLTLKHKQVMTSAPTKKVILAQLESPVKVPVSLRVYFDTFTNTTISFYFDDELWVVSPGEKLSVYDGMDRKEVSPGNRVYLPKLKQEFTVDKEFKPGFKGQMENFIDCFVRASSQQVRCCTLNEAQVLTSLCEELTRVG